jgi:hypothetical protein
MGELPELTSSSNKQKIISPLTNVELKVKMDLS